MGSERAVHMVPLVQVATPFEARLLAARLGAEGFLWELRGAVDGPYPLGAVTVLVEDHDVESATELLGTDGDALDLFDGTEPAAFAGENDAELGSDVVVMAATTATTRRRRLLLAGAALGGAGLVAARVVSVSGAA
ncbi:MAG: hypothetical protein JJU45_04090 [Acidimicrobiia bacterium]|nr:hypothetical protein [Acidimicrobiia bacterium]